MSGSSPAATGPAGHRFEGQVGAHYLLTMLAHAEPRGLPGTAIEQVAFQRGDDGFPLDDVIVHAHENISGKAATLQIQVKRTIRFTPRDLVFKKVVGQIAQAIKAPDFWAGRNELAIATARTTTKADGAYQDVLRWARRLGSATMFFERLNRPGVASDDVRAFVETLRNNLREFGALDNDEIVWKVLARLQILIFDYTAIGSAAEELARERAVRVLPPADAANAASLWGALTDLALEIAADGGDLDQPRLLTDLSAKSIRIASDRRIADVREAVTEASRLALADMDDQIGGIFLARTERIEAINAARALGRYIEIRGDAGVGKSGVMKHFAELFATEGRIIVLSPIRTQPRGWPILRNVLGFNGTAQELLSDLASDGGAALFIDNLDAFSYDERLTVNDLLRAASDVPGVAVIATARRNFGVDEPSWLDQKAVKTLVAAPTVVIEELSVAEVAELAHAEPSLADLLQDKHPAREVVRNLYRLSRLAARRKSGRSPTTELDMAGQWWSSADGAHDAGHRERARLLRTLAEIALGGVRVLGVKDKPVAPINALIRSETLRDLGGDKVTFRHDVLRQWAIGNLLAADQVALEMLPLIQPASAILARGVELAARFLLANESDGDGWAAMLDRLSTSGVHGSWRRAALLALVHAENSDDLLDRQSARLLDNDGALLRELVRTVMAVDVEPASQLLAQLGVDPAQIPPNMFTPTSASWVHLIIFLLKLGDRIPAQALGDIIDLYSNWMLGTLGHGPLTPNLLECLHDWLVELEREDRAPGATPLTFSGRFGHREGCELVEKLRTIFVMFADKRPDLATDYLNRVRAYKFDRGAVSSIMNFRGTLAQAAPKELAALTAEQLIREPKEKYETYRRREREKPFEYIDHEFLPAAPAQGPFFELLTHASGEGLDLIRKLVDHAIQFRARGRHPGDDGLRVPLADGEQFFPWTWSYRWSRGDSNDYAVASGLMALEAWAHQRIEKGDDFNAVLKDVLGPPGSPAAFLLLAVDLVISQWPKSQTVAVPFLACPELLSADRTRQMHDHIEYPDILGLKALHKEPVGAVTRDSLKQRASRQLALEHILGRYGCFGPEPLRSQIERLLQVAAQRLGAPEPSSSFADPRLMACHALNLLDPKNWPECEVEQADGTRLTARGYVPPEEEDKHVAALNAGSAAKFAAANMRTALLGAIDDQVQSSAALAERAVAWAQDELARSQSETLKDADDHDGEGFLSGEAIRAAALVALRDGDDDLICNHGAWAEQVLSDALKANDEVAHRMRSGLKFNPVATAFAGIAVLYRREPTPERLRTLLEIATRESPAGVHGFAVAAASLAELDERLPKAIVRSAFGACVKPVRRWNLSEEEVARQVAHYVERRRKAVGDELAWLTGSGSEPIWPDFEPEGLRPPRRRRGLEIGQQAEAAPPKTYVDEQAAALWIGAIRAIMDVSKRPWLRELARAYANFSTKLNGLGMCPNETASESPTDWNNNYYALLARTLIGLSDVAIDELAIARITALPDRSFFDITPTFLRAVDVIYFNDHLLEAEAPIIRQRFADRLATSWGWQRIVGERSGSIEVHLGPAVAALFFNQYVFRNRKCYLTAKAMERVGPFLPAIIDLLAKGPSYFAGLLTMDLLELSHDAALLPVLVTGGTAWITSYGDDTGFWVEHGIGRRLCAWVDKVREETPNALAPKQQRQAIDAILAVLVRLGVAEAQRLESALVVPH